MKIPYNLLCVFAEIYPHIKDMLGVRDEADLLRMCRQRNAPMYFRTGTQRSTPAMWKKSDWLRFAIVRWGSLRPDLIQKMFDAGFEPEITKPVAVKKTRVPK